MARRKRNLDPPRAPGDPLRIESREAFAQEVASGAPVTVAYVTAGYEDTPSVFANELMLARPSYDDRVAQKVEWLRSKLYPLLDADPIHLFEVDKKIRGVTTPCRGY